MDHSTSQGNPTNKVDHLKQVMKQTLVSGKTSNKSNNKSRIVPTGAQATHQIAVFDMSQYLPQDHYNEMLPNIFLGDFWLAKEESEQKKLGITHIVNCAQGKKFTQIDTSEEYYAPFNIKYYGVPGVMDMVGAKLKSHFHPAADFIKDALENNGRIYIHCHQGISRSSTILIAYLLIHEGYSLEKAVTTLRLQRAIFPNDGFIKQLIELENELGHAKASLE